MNKNSDINKLVEHFFKYESGKMVAVLTGLFGSENLIVVEDIVQDTILEAISSWTYKGIPKNSIAWLYKVAKNKSINAIKREKYKNQYITDNNVSINNQQLINIDLDNLFSQKNIKDEQLRMMFLCCNSSISKDSQIALILKTLCGFSISEISKAYFTNNETINKRLVRARKGIKENNFIIKPINKKELNNRIEPVLNAIYLLFNEGYNASVGNKIIREELCKESIRLTKIIVDNESITDKSNSFALLALMQLNSSRFNSRKGINGNIFTLKEQNRSSWDFDIMEQGFSNLERSTHSTHISKYHLLASISAYHCSAKDYESTDWKSILSLYNQLVLINNSPIILLNRAVVLSKIGNNTEAISELDKIENKKEILNNYLFYTIKSEFLIAQNDYVNAKINLSKAVELTTIKCEKELLKSRFKIHFQN